MSSIGVVVFRNSALSKTQVLQESVNNSVNITNNDGNKNVRREIIIVRKKEKVQSTPPTISVTSLVHATSPANSNLPAKRPRIRETVEEVKTPTPLAVARRNARERNRVRQVNDGFAALRRHIPDEVAAVFENVNSNRGPNKKLSKVETLRMAVEYIRNLESLLNIGHADKENNTNSAIDSFPSPASSSPRESSYDRSYFSLNSPALDDEDIDEDELDGSLPQQYIDLATSDTFQLVSTPHLYEEEENTIQPLTPSSDLLGQDEVNSHILSGHFPFPNSAEQFTVIPEQNYCSENEVMATESDFDVKYEVLNSNFNENTQLPLEGINPGMMLSQVHYKFKGEDVFLDDQQFTEMELKTELPDIQVTQEDREQFEETLKWWQEKTKLSRSSPKRKN